MSARTLLALACAAVATIGSSTASSATVIYQFTGDIRRFDPVYGEQVIEQLVVTIELPGLQADLPSTLTDSILSYTVDDSRLVLDESNSNLTLTCAGNWSGNIQSYCLEVFADFPSGDRYYLIAVGEPVFSFGGAFGECVDPPECTLLHEDTFSGVPFSERWTLVPEPSTAVLMLSSLAVLGARQRRLSTMPRRLPDDRSSTLSV